MNFEAEQLRPEGAEKVCFAAGASDTLRTRIVVISLESATTRRAAFTANNPGVLDKQWQYFDAHSALAGDLNYDEEKAIVRGGRNLIPTELACYSSHYALWEKLIADEAHDRYLILEDDVIVDWLFVKNLLKLSPDELPVNFLRLFYMQSARSRVHIGPILSIYRIIELLEPGFGAQAYLIDKTGARELVDNLRNIVEPVDVAIESCWQHRLPNLCIFPFPVIHPMGQSQIEGARWVSEPKSLRLKLARGRFKVATAIANIFRRNRVPRASSS